MVGALILLLFVTAFALAAFKLAVLGGVLAAFALSLLLLALLAEA